VIAITTIRGRERKRSLTASEETGWLLQNRYFTQNPSKER